MLMNSRAELRWEIFQRTLKGVKGRDGADSCLFSEAEESAALTVAQSRNSAVFSFPFANQKLQFLSPLLFFFFLPVQWIMSYSLIRALDRLQK